MFDTSRALADMASQIRAGRCADGLTLQQLATRSGVAASTIHKVEAQQMVPTVSVLLKIARGLGCRPEELIRDGDENSGGGSTPSISRQASADTGITGETRRADGLRPPDRTRLPRHERLRVWKLDLSPGQALPDLAIEPGRRFILLVEGGAVDLGSGQQSLSLAEGDCVDIDAGDLCARVSGEQPARLTLIGAPHAAAKP